MHHTPSLVRWGPSREFIHMHQSRCSVATTPLSGAGGTGDLCALTSDRAHLLVARLSQGSALRNTGGQQGPEGSAALAEGPTGSLPLGLGLRGKKILQEAGSKGWRASRGFKSCSTSLSLRRARRTRPGGSTVAARHRTRGQRSLRKGPVTVVTCLERKLGFL